MAAAAGNGLTDVPGLRVGHVTLTGGGALTGTTVLLVPPGAVCGVDVRGGAPSTRETSALAPGGDGHDVAAVVLTGGSAYGLASAHGVLEWFGEDRLVPAAALFDLGRGGDFAVRPTAATGAEAARVAATSPAFKPVPQGNVGAGTGAVAAELKGGIGTASADLGGGLVVAAMVALNAHGTAVDPATGLPFAAGLAEFPGEFPSVPLPSERLAAAGERLAETVTARTTRRPINTIIGVVATSAALTAGQAHELAALGQDGLALSVRPSHGLGDGDTLFSVATGDVSASAGDVAAVLGAAARVVARSVAHAVLAAEPVTTGWGHIDSYGSLYR